MTSGVRQTDRYTTIAALALLLILAAGQFAMFHLFNGVMVGRDSSQHAMSFLFSFAGQSWNPEFLHHFNTIEEPQYGPAFRLLTLPAWLAFGTYPFALSAVNFFIGIIVLVLGGFTLRRLGAKPSWILAFGLLLLGSQFWLRVFLTYNYDAIYAAAGLFGFTALIAKRDRCAIHFPVWCAALLFCAFIRLNTLIYLLVPSLFLMAPLIFGPRRSRSWILVGRSFRQRRAWWSLTIGLLLVDLWYYIPKLGEMFHKIFTHPDFQFHDDWGPKVTLWSWENWTWFFSHLPQAIAPGILLIFVPIAIWAWWKLPRRRLVVALFTLVPLGFYCLIIGTRQIEFIAPSILLLILFMAFGLSQITDRKLRWPALVFVLVFGFAQFWNGVFHFPPIPFAQHDGTMNRALEKTLSFSRIFPDEESLGTYETAHHILPVLFSDDQKRSVGAITLHDWVPRLALVPMLWSVFEDSPAHISTTAFEPPNRAAMHDLDALLVFDDAKPGDRIPEAIKGKYRTILSLRLYQVYQAHVMLPR
jgi:hypothetical protein